MDLRGGGRGAGGVGESIVVNGVTVPKFGPGAFEALKAARAKGSTNVSQT